MATEIPLSTTSSTSLRGWAQRLFGGAGPADRATAATLAREDQDALVRAASAEAPARVAPDVVQRLLADDRYVFILLKEAIDSIDDRHATRAWKALGEQMAIVPEGGVPVIRSDGATEPVHVQGFYLERTSVTNEQFARFVRAGGYDNLEIWPQEVWPSVMTLVDRTGQPGPRWWHNGTYPSGRGDHPVVGVCWYEAVAYARWIGKRLPTSAEWQKAAGWPEQYHGGTCRRYPWGEIYAEGRANIWSAGIGQTVPVREFRPGSTPNGIYQLSGNVWEWLDDPLDAIPGRQGEIFHAPKPMRRIIGGAFDTYLPTEATNYFVTGQPELHRRANIGFRCVVSADRLRPAH
jgi:iron(II)-dependent oxidoreductase